MMRTIDVLNCQKFQAIKRTTERKFTPMLKKAKKKKSKRNSQTLAIGTNKVNQWLCKLANSKVIKSKESQISAVQ